MLGFGVGSTVVGDGVQRGGCSEALFLVEDDGWGFAFVLRKAGVTDEDGLLAEVAGCFVTDVLEGEGDRGSGGPQRNAERGSCEEAARTGEQRK